jgi:hypothetical protein
LAASFLSRVSHRAILSLGHGDTLGERGGGGGILVDQGTSWGAHGRQLWGWFGKLRIFIDKVKVVPVDGWV